MALSSALPETDDTSGGFLIPEALADEILHGGRWVPRSAFQALKARFLPEWLTSMWWPVKLRFEPWLKLRRPDDPPPRYATITTISTPRLRW